MSNQKKTHELIRQNEKIVKKSQKHDANLQKNSTLYFQVGLIVCLLAAFGLLEMKFETRIPPVVDVIISDMDYVDDVPIFRPEVKVVDEPVKSRVKTPAEKFVEVPDSTPDIFISETPEHKRQSDPILAPGDVNSVEPPIENVIVDFKRVEVVPIYPGCEKKKTNDAKRKCMSEKITKLVQRKFQGSDIASNYGLTGIQKINVQFTIDKTGLVNDIKTRSPHPKLDDEAVRVINFIPKMTPGKQRDKNVGVIYSLPIKFKVQD